MSQSATRFTENFQDVERLLNIHRDIGGIDPGRRIGLEVLNKSAVIFITACWEAYCEDVCKEAFETLLVSSNIPDQYFPNKVLVNSSNPLRACKDEREIWKLAGENWKNVLRSYAEKKIGELNTPKAENVRELFFDVFGLDDVTQNWYWRKMSRDRAREKLNNFITVRGSIAHRTTFDEPINRPWVSSYVSFTQILVRKTDETICRYIANKIGNNPW